MQSWTAVQLRRRLSRMARTWNFSRSFFTWLPVVSVAVPPLWTPIGSVWVSWNVCTTSLRPTIRLSLHRCVATAILIIYKWTKVTNMSIYIFTLSLRTLSSLRWVKCLFCRAPEPLSCQPLCISHTWVSSWISSILSGVSRLKPDICSRNTSTTDLIKIHGKLPCIIILVEICHRRLLWLLSLKYVIACLLLQVSTDHCGHFVQR